VLRGNFSHREFLPGQREAISELLGGRSALLVAPTGSGKSLCYQFPAAFRGATVLVVAPLIALMQDQVERLDRRSGVVGTCINSFVSTRARAAMQRQMADGKYELVYVSPERLDDEGFVEAAQAAEPWLLAVDEAHCIAEWGHDFRPAYLRIRSFAERVGAPPILGTTATATSRTREEIIAQLGLEDARVIVTGLDRPNLFFEVRRVHTEEQKLAHLCEILRGLQERALVYVGTRVEAETVAGFLREELRLPADCYHGGMDKRRRQQVHDDFRTGSTRVVAATMAFGMGIDQPAVRKVVHYTFPDSLEAYYQQAGRAGRDGESAECVLLYWPEDRSLHEHLAAHSTPQVAHLLAVYQVLAPDLRGGGAWVTEEGLSRDTGLGSSMIRVALEELIAAGAFRVRERRANAALLTLGEEPTAKVLGAYAQRADRLRRAHLQRLDHMMAYAERDLCRRGMLLRYFGERAPKPRPDCCDVCARRSPRSAPHLPEAKVRFAVQVGRFHGWTLGLHRQQTPGRPHSGPGGLLYEYKYRGDAEAGRKLAYLMAKLAGAHSELGDADLVVGIPPTQAREGEPPSVGLARQVAQRLALPFARDLLIRVSSRRPQKELRTREEKQRNVAGTFEVSDANSARGRRVLLVDDVFDSGATLNEAGRMLLRAGASEVVLLTAVRTSFGWRRD